MSTGRAAGFVGRLAMAAGLAVFVLLLATTSARAADPERDNCPDGFIWIRMSGTACVQETVPANGRIGYDGHAICNDGFSGIYEFRNTPNGKGVLGNPASVYSYLLECVTPEEAARRVAAGTGGDLTELLAGRKTVKPDAEDLVVIGLTASGGILVAASRFRRRPKPPTLPPAEAQASPPSEPASETAPAIPEPLPSDPAEIERRLKQLRDIDEKLRAAADRIREGADAGTLTFEDKVAWVGGIMDILGPLTGPLAPYAGAVSIAANLIQMSAEAIVAAQGSMSIKEMNRDLRDRLADIARLRGLISGDVQALEQALADAAPPPERTPERIDLNPAVMSDEMLREERARAQQRVNNSFETDRKAQEESDRLREEQRAQRSMVDYWRRELADFDAQRRAHELPSSAGQANTDLNLAASFEGFVQQYGEDAAAAVAKEAAADLGVARGGAVDFVKVAAAARADEAATSLLDHAKRAGTAANVVGQGTAAVSLVEWIRQYTAEQQRVVIEHEVERLAFRMGELDGQLVRADQQAAATTTSFRDEVAHRNAVGAEQSRRAEQRGHVLWTE